MCSYTRPPIRSLDDRVIGTFLLVVCFTLLIDGLLSNFSCFLLIHNYSLE